MTPRTAAGRALLGKDIRTEREMASDGGRHSPGYLKLQAAILAIEAEADRATVERIRADVEGQLKGKHTDAFDEGADAAYRDVLAILTALAAKGVE